MKTFVPYAFLLLLSACDTEPTHDVQYYLDHPKERMEKLAVCRNNPGEKALTPNCKNAKAAASHQILFGGTTMPKIR